MQVHTGYLNEEGMIELECHHLQALWNNGSRCSSLVTNATNRETTRHWVSPDGRINATDEIILLKLNLNLVKPLELINTL